MRDRFDAHTFGSSLRKAILLKLKYEQYQLLRKNHGESSTLNGQHVGAPFQAMLALSTLTDNAEVVAHLAEFHAMEGGGTEWRVVWLTDDNRLASVTASCEISDWSSTEEALDSKVELAGWIAPISSISSWELSGLVVAMNESDGEMTWETVTTVRFDGGYSISLPLFGDLAVYDASATHTLLEALRNRTA